MCVHYTCPELKESYDSLICIMCVVCVSVFVLCIWLIYKFYFVSGSCRCICVQSYVGQAEFWHQGCGHLQQPERKSPIESTLRQSGAHPTRAGNWDHFGGWLYGETVPPHAGHGYASASETILVWHMFNTNWATHTFNIQLILLHHVNCCFIWGLSRLARILLITSPSVRSMTWTVEEEKCLQTKCLVM